MNKKRLEMRKDQPQAKEHFQEKGHECGTKEMEVENLVDSRTWKAAICIQRRWRGYRTRNLNDEVLAACKDIQLSRMQEYIT